MFTVNIKEETKQKDTNWYEIYTINFTDKENNVQNNCKFEKAIRDNRIIINEEKLEMYLSGKSRIIKKYMKKRLKLLLDTCSKDLRKGNIALETVNRLADFCMETIPLIENNKIVIPNPDEFLCLAKWYIDIMSGSYNEPGNILTTVCPDYPFGYYEGRAVYKEGELGDDIGLVGESILEVGAKMVSVFKKTLKIPFNWIVGYAGFEGQKENLESMNISREMFWKKLKGSASKLQNELGISVGIMPDMVGMTNEEFWKIRESFPKEQFNIERKGMNALSHATDTRDWACIYSVANHLNAIILDGASVYVGRRAYKKAERIIKSEKQTPRFFCITNYEGYAE